MASATRRPMATYGNQNRRNQGWEGPLSSAGGGGVYVRSVAQDQLIQAQVVPRTLCPSASGSAHASHHPSIHGTCGMALQAAASLKSQCQHLQQPHRGTELRASGTYTSTQMPPVPRSSLPKRPHPEPRSALRLQVPAPPWGAGAQKHQTIHGMEGPRKLPWAQKGKASS